MARRTLSTQGRVLAAGVSIAVGGALIGFMAAGDHTANASSSHTSSATVPSNGGGANATPYGDSGSSNDNNGFSSTPSGDTGFTPQPQTRTGGS
jgi:hypothetical protein